MNKKYLNQSLKASLCALLIAPLTAFAEGGSDAKWEFGVGASTRVLGKTEFKGGIHSSAFEAAFATGAAILPGDLGYGTLGDTAREYDDGFVRASSLTGNIPATTYWGYDNLGQVDALADTLTFSRDIGTSSSLSNYNTIGGSSSDRPSTKVTPYFELSRIFKYKDNENIEFGFISTFMMLDTSASRGLTAVSSMNLNINHNLVVDTYDLNGVIPPTAPYEGSFNPPGPLLEYVPDRENIETPDSQSTTVYGFLEDKLTIDVQTLSLGVLARRLHAGNYSEEGGYMSRLSGQIEGGVTFNRIDLEWNRDTRIVSGGEVVAREKLSYRDIEYKLGGYGALGLRYRLDDEAKHSLGLKARYDYLGEEKVGNAGAGAKVDLSSWGFILSYVRTF